MGSADAVVFAPEVQNRVVHRFQQMPLLSARNNERYPMGVSCLSIEASSKALALWRRSQAPSGTQFPLLPGPLGLDFCPPIVHTKTDAPLLYLARTNLGWFAAAVALAEKGMRFYVDPKGAYHDLCKRTRAVEALCIRNELEDSRLKMYRDENGPSFSCRRIHQAAEKGVLDGNFGGPFKEKKNKQAARFWLSTVHKVKGLETPYVQLANDFTKLSTPEERACMSPFSCPSCMQKILVFGFPCLGEQAQTPDDDTYLVYVAVTRATRMLFINSDLCWVQSPRVSQEPCPCLECTSEEERNIRKQRKRFLHQLKKRRPPPGAKAPCVSSIKGW
ncbi:hypothetical protein DUNSADRAFT_16948 [Dunaliella salina]|uniref:UvrD-like helicase C-terminal domain-containing protein n=1 Tax=Dunaliella salina TaxID=3046 RepID=A0ABQ7H0L2_DUNSA|nr:hypothetical protein DUNSADRAFT_16948 [Dunaliella salina]|eukprot:KAF5840400.1 hypothetical protein DUNSADRAFT_16948 [Dunaliella salina]